MCEMTLFSMGYNKPVQGPLADTYGLRTPFLQLQPEAITKN